MNKVNLQLSMTDCKSSDPRFYDQSKISDLIVILPLKPSPLII